MSKKPILISAVVIFVVLLGVLALTHDGANKLNLKQIYVGYNQVFPVKDGSLVIYTGHSFIKYQDGSMAPASPDTGAVLSNITVSSDGSTAAAYAEYLDGSDILSTSFGVHSNSWVRFNLQNKTAFKIETESSRVFALNNQSIAVLQESTDINDNSSKHRLVVFDDKGESKLAHITGAPSQVHELNSSLVVMISGVTKNSIFRVNRNSSDLVANTSRRSSLSPDGQYYYSVDYSTNNTELVDKEGELNVYNTGSKKLESSKKISPGTTVGWSGNNLLAETNVQTKQITVTAYPSKNTTSYLISGNLGGSSLALSDGVINVSGGGIQKSVPPLEKITEIESLLAEKTNPGYSIHITGKNISVHVNDTSITTIIDQLKKEIGDNYINTGFVFRYPQTNNLDTN